MSDTVYNRMRAEAARQAAANANPLVGIVTAYDPVQYAVKVKLMPEGAFPETAGDLLETDWIPLGAHVLGNGLGIFAPPATGAQVHVKFVDGEIGSAIVDGALFDLTNLPLPADTNGQGVPAGDIWIVGTNNNRMTLAGTGDSLTLKHHLGSTIVVDGTAQAGEDAITLTHHAGQTLKLDNTGKVVATKGGTPSPVVTQAGPSSVMFADP